MSDITQSPPITPPNTNIISPTSPTPGGNNETPQQPEIKKIKISAEKTKNLYYFSDLTARYLDTEDLLNISGLGEAIGKVVTTIDHLRAKEVIKIEKIHTDSIPSVELVVTVSKGPKHADYLKSMDERRSRHTESTTSPIAE